MALYSEYKEDKARRDRNRDEELSRCRQALRDIATSEPIPSPGEAYAWCKQVATDALNPK